VPGSTYTEPSSSGVAWMPAGVIASTEAVLPVVVPEVAVEGVVEQCPSGL
jgi:hypothetical protein